MGVTLSPERSLRSRWLRRCVKSQQRRRGPSSQASERERKWLRFRVKFGENGHPGSGLDELAAEQRLLNRELHIVRTPNAHFMFEFECLGETLSPSRVIEPIGSMEDGEIITGTLAALEDDLRRYWDAQETGRR